MFTNYEKLYDMSHAKRGIAVLVNIKRFRTKNEERFMAEKDVDSLTKLFEKFNFDLRIYTDLKSSDIRKLMKELSEIDYTNDDCFVCIIMTDGNKEIILGADNNQIYLQDLINPFNLNKSLKGKPKLFFIQACRSHGQTQAMDQSVLSADLFPNIQIEADYLVYYSITSSNILDKDTYFFQNFCKLLEKETDMDLSQILVMANNSVTKNGKQTQIIVNRLTKKLYLYKRLSKGNVATNSSHFFNKPNVNF